MSDYTHEVRDAMQASGIPQRDLSMQYNTQLTPEQEAAFQQSPYANDVYDYDARGEFAAGADRSNETQHGTDEFKKPNHPTFSTGSRYNGVDGAQGGEWVRRTDGSWQFTPGPTNLQNYTPQQLQEYFTKYEPGNVLVLPQGSR